MKVDKNYLKGRIESFIFDKLKNKNYQIHQIEPTKLLTWNRFIISFNLLYLELKHKNYNLAFEIYNEICSIDDGMMGGPYYHFDKEPTKVN